MSAGERLPGLGPGRRSRKSRVKRSLRLKDTLCRLAQPVRPFSGSRGRERVDDPCTVEPPSVEPFSEGPVKESGEK